MESTPATKIEKFLKPKAVSSRKLARDPAGRLVMAEESALDMDRIRDAGLTVMELGRRVRVYNSDMTKQVASYIVPAEVTEIQGRATRAAEGAKIQIGRLIAREGLWVRHNPGLREVGINDRGDVVLRQDAATAEDPTVGPTLNSYNTTQSTLTSRVVARIDKKTHDRDVKEARAWLEAMNVLNDTKTLRTRFFSAGVACEHRGNVPMLYKTTQVNFFPINDPLSLELASALEARFEDLKRPVPMVRVISVLGIPPNERAYKEFVAQLKKKKQNPITLGLPSRLRDSQFFDGSSKSIPPSCFIYACTLDEIGDSIYVITINTDYHGEVKSRGINSGVAAVMSNVEVLSVHASCGILNAEGSTTVFMGSGDVGKSKAVTFWAERNHDRRRSELLRRYKIEKKDDEKAAKEATQGVGFVCQDDWVEIVPSGNTVWDSWPAERFFYMRSRDLPSRDLILSENEPIIENATADYGASGDPAVIGRTTHDDPHERLLYDPDWDNYYADRDVHRISCLVVLEKDRELDYLVRRLSAKDALDMIMAGGVGDGATEPFYNDYTDVSGLLMSQGVVGERLLGAYKAAKAGDVAALMNGDEALGRVVLDRLNAQVAVWQHFLNDVPCYVVNTSGGGDVLQDLNWYVSDNPEFLKPGKEKSVDEFKALMEKTYGVAYDNKGDWTHDS